LKSDRASSANSKEFQLPGQPWTISFTMSNCRFLMVRPAHVSGAGWIATSVAETEAGTVAGEAQDNRCNIEPDFC
jgi:hypothetical protein